MNENITAIVFDLGGTLRIALKDKEWMKQGEINMAKLAGTDLSVEDFYAMVEERYEKYREWALRENKESNDEELWCKWLLYDYPRDRIMANRHQLSYEYRQSKGRRVVVDHGEEVLRELYKRGYKLGIISRKMFLCALGCNRHHLVLQRAFTIQQKHLWQIADFQSFILHNRATRGLNLPCNQTQHRGFARTITTD